MPITKFKPRPDRLYFRSSVTLSEPPASYVRPNVLAVRTEQRMTRKKVASRARLSVSRLRCIELALAHSVAFVHANRIAAALGLSLHKVFPESDHATRPKPYRPGRIYFCRSKKGPAPPYLARRIQHVFRERAGLTQEQAAAKCGILVWRLRRIERAASDGAQYVELAEAERMAVAYGVSVPELFPAIL